MTTVGQPAAHSRLMDLERIVTLLNKHLRALQQELRQTGARSAAHQPSWWVWHNRGQKKLFMSAICNRHIRPNLRKHDLNFSPTPR
ncbi:MAG: hypothetical protein NNA21_00090 [Nitrospira sp.]|nr:hypothetical protein [Nitrospira sp.]MCP9460793.1 hypothetical protein [Nitrospira sp.]MCP9475008.1 hypothetical protein [Nitrospira sp.]